MENHYDTLGVSRDANIAEMKKAYRRLAYPDHNPDSPVARERFEKVRKAYAVLGDAGKKRAYDRKLGFKNAAPPPRWRP